MYQRMASTFRPLVGVVGRVVASHLGLRTPPLVKLDLYPVRVNNVTQGVMILPHATSRAPVFRITLPVHGVTGQELQSVCEVLRDTMEGYDNSWYRLAGFDFRVSRRARQGQYNNSPRKRYWMEPGLVYRLNRRLRYYSPKQKYPAPDQVLEIGPGQWYGDQSDDDQDELVDDMWNDVRRMRHSGYNGRNTYEGSFAPPY